MTHFRRHDACLPGRCEGANLHLPISLGADSDTAASSRRLMRSDAQERVPGARVVIMQPHELSALRSPPLSALRSPFSILHSTLSSTLRAALQAPFSTLHSHNRVTRHRGNSAHLIRREFRVKLENFPLELDRGPCACDLHPGALQMASGMS